MRTVLKSKSSYGNAEIASVWKNIGDYVSADEAADAVDKAVSEVADVVGRKRDAVVYGWSGGKDSLALQVVMEKAGISRGVCGVISRLEFRSCLEWIDQNRPDGVTLIDNKSLTLEWLGRPANDRYLFPANARDGYFWTLASARFGQYSYQVDHRPELQIYGRRTQDGNICGDRNGIHKTSKLTAYNPLRAWPHELVLGVVHYFGKTLPPVYNWPNGWKTGNGSWPGRRIGDRDTSWAETYAIEPDRVREAAEHVPSAREWLERNR